MQPLSDHGRASRVIVALVLILLQSRAGPARMSLSDCPESEADITTGRALAAKKQYPDAIQHFRSALARCPASRDAALELARAYLEIRAFPKAEKTAKDLLARDPYSRPAQLLLADSYFMQQRFQEAGQLLQKLLAQDPDNADAHKLMGLTLFFYKQDVMAENELLSALRLRPKDDEALYYLGRVYYTQNSFFPAIEAFRRLVADDPKSYKGYDHLGLCYEATGKTDEAAAAFKQAQALARLEDPAYDWPWGNLAELLMKQDRFAEALPYAREAVSINPRSARNQYLLGKSLSETDPQAAVSYLTKAAELDTSYPEPHYLLGKLYQKLGRRDEAAKEFATFQQLSSAHSVRR